MKWYVQVLCMPLLAVEYAGEAMSGEVDMLRRQSANSSIRSAPMEARRFEPRNTRKVFNHAEHVERVEGRGE